MGRSSLHTAQPRILSSLNETGTILFTFDEMRRFFTLHKKSWEVATSVSFDKFLIFMVKNTKLKEHAIAFPNRLYKRYTWGRTSAYHLTMSIIRNAYFTHRSAMFINGLIDTEPQDIFLNTEQRLNKYADRTLEQSKINMAFSREVRQTNNIAKFDGKKIYLLNGMYTGNLGVHTLKLRGNTLSTTNLERTLIDIAVRPIYSGGVLEVGGAFCKAKAALSIQKLAEMLGSLDYIYPYHQVIGFYLDKTGVYDRDELTIFRKPGLQYDFYLTHNMAKTAFCPEWRLHYPANFAL